MVAGDFDETLRLDSDTQHAIRNQVTTMLMNHPED